MKQNRIFLFALLVLGILQSCTQSPQQITEKVRKATVGLIDDNFGTGSGFFIAPDMIVTNIHVVAGDRDVSVFGKDSKGTVVYNIEKVIGSDPTHDLVILQVSGKQKGTPLSLSNCRIGEPIFVTGYPKGGKYKVTDGIVYYNSNTKIRHDAKTSPGSSGGPLLNIKGEVIGITLGGDGANAALFNAIPSNILKALLKKSKSGQGQSWEEWQKEDSIRAYVYYKSGIKKGEDNKYDKAIEDYTKAVELYRNFTDAYKNRGVARHRLGNSNRKNGNLKKARSLYEEAIEDLNKSLDGAYAYYLLAKAKYDLGNLETHNENREVEKALKHYQDAVSDYSTAIAKQSPDYPIFLEKAYFYRSLAKIRLGELKTDKEKAITLYYNEAINDLTEAVRIDLNDELNARPYLHRAEAYFRLGDLKAAKGNTEKAQSLYSEGLNDFAKAVKLDPDGANDFKLDPQGTAYGYYIQGGLELILGQSKAGQGDVKKAQKHYQRAFQSYDEAKNLNPDDADVYYDKAIKILNPDNADTYQMRGVFKSLLGQSKAKRGDVAEARLHYQGAITDYQEAIKRYEEVTKQNSEFTVLAYNNLGYTKYLLGKSFESKDGQENMEHAQKLYEEAIVHSNEAIRLNPDHAIVYSTRGYAKAALKDYAAAIADFSKTIETIERNSKFIAKAYWERGLAYQKIGQHERAKVDFAEAKKLDPDIENK